MVGCSLCRCTALEGLSLCIDRAQSFARLGAETAHYMGVLHRNYMRSWASVSPYQILSVNNLSECSLYLNNNTVDSTLILRDESAKMDSQQCSALRQNH